MRTYLKFILTLLLVLVFQSLSAEVRLPKLISDGMILQRDTELKIWGWADPGEKVLLIFNKKKYKTTGGDDGEWKVKIPPMKTGGPYTMEIIADNRIIIKDILFGDVWVCSGQSNMTHNLGRHAERYATEIGKAIYPEIRQLFVPTTALLTGRAKDHPDIKWIASSPETVLDFTVIGYFFAKEIYEKYEVPIGIINTCVGGTRIESWTSEDGLKAFPEIYANVQQNKDTGYVNSINREVLADRKAAGPKELKDKGLLNNPKWYAADYKPLNWKRINIPGYWEDQGMRNLDGVVWYRREIEVPESMTGVDALVKLGRIVDADELYINGQKIGSTGYQYPQRRYKVAAGVLNAGINLFVIRVVNNVGNGGFVPDKPYYLLTAKDTIDLKGDWDCKVGEVFAQEKTSRASIRAQDQATSLFNGMIAPFTNYAVRGALWYQGESNASDPVMYKKLLPNLIRDWRSQWHNEKLPFLIAQLPNYMEVDHSPVESNWALMREVQMQTALEIPNTGMGINIDLGEWNDIHPGNKKPVAERLALQAMEITYGEQDIVSSGPVYASSRIEGNRIIVTFEHTGSGLVSGNEEELGHFAIAGADLKFKWARAIIHNNEVEIWCDEIAQPQHVRYAWADNPDFANLYNKEGLPASPFRTDK